MIFYRLLSWLPFPMLYLVAWWGYLMLYYVTGYRKEVVRQNLSRAFPEKSENEITVLAKKFYRQLAQVTVEIIKARRMTKSDFAQRVKITNPELLKDYSENFSKSVILLTIHQGNWEWMLHGVSLELGIPLDAVYKPLHNKTANQLIYEIRSRFGSRPLTVADSTRDIIRRRRESRVFSMLADQAPIRSERSYWTTFMNQEAAFYLGPEVLATTTKFPVLFAQSRRLSTGHYELTFREVAKPPYVKGSHDILHRYIEMAEEAIRAEPESWLWSNRRWKRDRLQEEALEAREREQAEERRT